MAHPSRNQPRDQAVILLHGLARTKAAMAGMTRFLRDRGGYTCFNTGYPSRKFPIETLARTTIPAALAACRRNRIRTIHFVTHSMGAILLRYYLSRRTISGLGRVVMLSPPNQGSEVVDRLRHLWLFQRLNGPAGSQLGTGPDSLPCRLPPLNAETGIITGDRSVNPLLSRLIPGRNDGKVSVTRSKISGMTDFLVVHHAHPFIMNAPVVSEQTLFFLKQGRFDKKTA